MGRPKGSKNRTQNYETKLRYESTHGIGNIILPDIEEHVCNVCQRVAFGSIVTLPFGKFRHEDCSIGSEEWKAYVQRQSKADQTTLNKLGVYFEGIEGV